MKNTKRILFIRGFNTKSNGAKHIHVRLHIHDDVIITIQHSNRIGAKNSGLGRRVLFKITMPIQMILSHIQNSRCIGMKTVGVLKLEAREF